MKRIYKRQVISQLEESNESYRLSSGGQRGVYLIGTLKKRYNPATECKMWTVGTNFFGNRVLGETLAHVYDRLEDKLFYDRIADQPRKRYNYHCSVYNRCTKRQQFNCVGCQKHDPCNPRHDLL